jgi:hypothetical protein
MPIGIGDPALPKAVGLIDDRKDLARARTNSVGCGGIRVIDDEVDPHRRPIERFRAQVERFRVLVDDEEPQPIDRQLGDHVPGRRRESLLFDSVECVAIEVDCRRRVLDVSIGVSDDAVMTTVTAGIAGSSARPPLSDAQAEQVVRQRGEANELACHKQRRSAGGR